MKWARPAGHGDEEDLFWELSNLLDLAGHPNIVRLWAAFWHAQRGSMMHTMESGVA